MAKISIILPSYNHAEFLKDRLDSILIQTYEDWELIIIDDHSTDNSFEILSEFVNQNKSKIKYFIRNEKNSGSGYLSWKKGIELANTEFIWIAETDDYSAPAFLEELVTILDQNEDVTFAFCGSNYIEDGKIIYDSSNRMKDLTTDKGAYKVLNNSVFLDRMPFNTYITNGSSCVFRKPTSEIPNQIFTHKQSSDIFLWSYLIQNKSFAYLNKNLNYFRRHQGTTTSMLYKNNLEMIYHEKADYLNYFEQTEKYEFFIDHYIKHYIWTHKRDFLNASSIENIRSGKKLKMFYFYKLFQFFLSKILKK